MKIAAVVILYYPHENVIENISSYFNSVEKLYLVDNTETSSKLTTDNLKRFPGAVYVHDGENKGIAERLNHVGNLALKDGFDWLLTMDQDSSFGDQTFTNYLNCLSSFEKRKNVSMFGINHVKELDNPDICNAVNVNHLITSGSVLNLQLMNEIGGFDEKLFIDEVDFEYCLRSVVKGFSIIQFANIFLTHNLGQTSQHRSFKTSKLTPRVLHSPVRIYYMTRNFLYVQSKYAKTFPREINLRRKVLFNRFKNNILYSRQRFAVMRKITRGFLDYRKKRMGKIK